MATAATIAPWVIAVLGVIGVIYYANKKSATPALTGNVGVDASNALADFESGLSKLSIVKDGKAIAADVKTSATFLAVSAMGHEVAGLVEQDRQATVQAAVSSLLTELVSVAAPPAKA